MWLDRRSLSREAELGIGTSQEPLLGQTRSAPQRVQSLHSGSAAAAAGSFGALLPRRLGRRSSFREEVSRRSPRDNSLDNDTVLEIREAGPSSVADSQVGCHLSIVNTIKLQLSRHGFGIH